jgi:hypothetical protein
MSWTKEEAEEYWLNQPILTHWWNGGKKTKDFEGSYKDFFADKGIKLTKITHKDTEYKHFEMCIGASKVTYETPSSVPDSQDAAIILFLTVLGDKATLYAHGREFHINWR